MSFSRKLLIFWLHNGGPTYTRIDLYTGKYHIQWIGIYLLVSAIHWITQKVLEVLLSLDSALSAETFPTKYTQGLALCTFSTKPLPPLDNELVMPHCVIMAVSNILTNNNSFFCFCLKGNCRHKC